MALAMLLSYVESLIPFYFGIPGMKLGLCNVFVVVMLYLTGAWQEALLINLCRIVLSGFLFGNAFSILYSFGGAFLSFVTMLILFRMKVFSVTAVSVVGGFFHNVGQVLVAALAMESTGVFWYLPVLMLAGMVTGGLIGILAAELLPRLSAVRNVFLDDPLKD